MSGSLVLRPIEANLTHNTDILKKMNPYVAVVVGNDVIKGQVCKHGGKHPKWEDAITVPLAANATEIVIEVMDKDRITKDDHIGNVVVSLAEVQAQGQTQKWYPLTYKGKPAGELLLEISSQGGWGGSQWAAGQSTSVTGTGYAGGYQEERFTGAAAGVGVGVADVGVTGASGLNVSGASANTQIFTEQRQVVEPHTFVKDVESVEIRPVQKTVEVLEPQRVLKEVTVTEAVPVTKTIEVNEPQVVQKEVEVIEPRVVTKQIQVVENVPVIKRVDVIENVPILKEVQTFEQQSYTKQVEVTEQVPVLKQVTVTEPVTVHKTVEYVEPVVTTQTIVKEVQQPVVVDERITTTVGPATVVGIITEQQILEQRRLWEQERIRIESAGLSEKERIEQLRIWEQQRLEKERLWEQQRSTTTYTTTSVGQIQNVPLDQKVQGYTSEYRQNQY